MQAQRGASAAAASARAGLYLALLDTFGREVWVHAPLDTDAGTCDEKAYRRASNRAGQQLRSGRGERGGTRAMAAQSGWMGWLCTGLRVCMHVCLRSEQTSLRIPKARKQAYPRADLRVGIEACGVPEVKEGGAASAWGGARTIARSPRTVAGSWLFGCRWASDARVLRDYDPGRHARYGEAGTLARAEWRPAAALGVRENWSTIC